MQTRQDGPTTQDGAIVVRMFVGLPVASQLHLRFTAQEGTDPDAVYLAPKPRAGEATGPGEKALMLCCMNMHSNAFQTFLFLSVESCRSQRGSQTLRAEGNSECRWSLTGVKVLGRSEFSP